MLIIFVDQVFAYWTPAGSLLAYESNIYNICIALSTLHSVMPQLRVMQLSAIDATAQSKSIIMTDIDDNSKVTRKHVAYYWLCKGH